MAKSSARMFAPMTLKELMAQELRLQVVSSKLTFAGGDILSLGLRLGDAIGLLAHALM